MCKRIKPPETLQQALRESIISYKYRPKEVDPGHQGCAVCLFYAALVDDNATIFSDDGRWGCWVSFYKEVCPPCILNDDAVCGVSRFTQ